MSQIVFLSLIFWFLFYFVLFYFTYSLVLVMAQNNLIGYGHLIERKLTDPVIKHYLYSLLDTIVKMGLSRKFRFFIIMFILKNILL